MRPSARRVGLAACAALLSTALPSSLGTAHADSPATRVLSRDLLPSSLLSNRLGDADPQRIWHVGVSVQGRDAAGLAELQRGQYDASSPSYRHFLSPQDYADRFGAAAADTSAVRDWLQASGLHVTFTNRAGTYLVADGTVQQVESAFGTTLGTYTAIGRTFVANDAAPTVPAAVTAVSGLDELSSKATTHAAPVASFPLPSDTSPSDLWSTYDQPSDNRGTGERLAAFGWGDPTGVDSDLRQFENENGLPAMPFQVVQVGDQGTDTAGRIEWNLDSQAASGMAPDAAGLTFYFAASGNSDLLAAAIQTWADDPAGAKQASGSYGLCDAFGYLGVFDAHEAALTQAAVEGRSFFASTGDNGSGCSAAGAGVNGGTIGPIPSQEYPATSPHSVAVGGTVLYTTGSPAQRDKEIAWTHGGGGPSYYFGAPDWQAGLGPYSALGRAEADVSAQSGDLLSGYNIVSEGGDTIVGGTSLSAPLWQGMWARVNAAGPAGADGVPNLGYAAPLIYENNADATAYASSFFDVTVGDNGLYPAGPGYDYPTGWGVPRVSGLARALAGKTSPTPTGTTATPSDTATATISPTPSPSSTAATTTQSGNDPAPATTNSPTSTASPSNPYSAQTSPAASPARTPASTPPAQSTSAAPLTLAAAPRLLTAGGTSTVTVHGEPGQQVQLLATTAPGTAADVVRDGVTDAAGNVVFTVRPTRSTRLLARYTSHPAGTDSPPALVMVRSAVSLSAYRDGVRSYHFQGRVLPGAAGQVVTLYRVDSAGNEIRTATTRADSAGVWRIFRTFTGSGQFTFVVRTSQTPNNAAGVSNSRLTIIH